MGCVLQNRAHHYHHQHQHYRFTPLMASYVYKQPHVSKWLIEHGASLPRGEGEEEDEDEECA